MKTTHVNGRHTVSLDYEDGNGVWAAQLTEVKRDENGIMEVRINFRAETPAPAPKFTLKWNVKQDGAFARWASSLHMNRCVPPNWACKTFSNLASSSPVLSFQALDGSNRITFAFSDALRAVELSGGIHEGNSALDCSVTGFFMPEAPLDSYEAFLRIDTRPLFYADAIREAFTWLETFYPPVPVPTTAFDPVYSSWYSYHKEALCAEAIEKEVRQGVTLGLNAVIVDDGWQTDRYDGGAYAYCGDWEATPSRFPNMRQHIETVHNAGMKYVLWYSVPFIGNNCRAYERFKGKFLYCREPLGAWVLDPRFPEVREYLIGIYETAVREWNLDGFKLDFIDSFCLGPGGDPAIPENYAGRDCKTVPEGVDKLLTDVMRRLRALKPDILVEFRQSYIGPAIKKYGNMLRAGDCPADALGNRVRTIDLRLSSGSAAVHSDMLMWDYSGSVEHAAAQFLAVLFSVPQISVRLAEIPENHSAMLAFWIGFWKRHRTTLLHGTLTPWHPELNYPLVTATSETESITVSYDEARIVPATPSSYEKTYLINASAAPGMIVELDSDATAELHGVCGTKINTVTLSAGIQKIAVPVSGFARIRKNAPTTNTAAQ